MNYSGDRGGMVICRPPKIEKRHQKILLMSDLHIGSVLTDHDLIREETREASLLEARIDIDGDLFENLFPSNQKQFNLQSLHRRIRNSNSMVNRCIDWAVEIFFPVAHLIDMVACGNHDERSTKGGGVDMVALLVKELRTINPNIHYGGYSGFIDYRFTFSSRRFVIYYHHGWGSGSSYASSAGDFVQAQHVEGVDCIWLGHKHSRMNMHVTRPSCPKDGHHPKIRDIRFVRTGSYMDTFSGQSQENLRKEGRKGNYAVDAGFAGHGKGGAWLNLAFDSKNKFKVSVTQ